MKATQRVSALRGGQPDDLIASGAGCEGISLRGASMRRKIGPNRPGIRGISVRTLANRVGAQGAEMRHHHHVAGPYLIRFAQEASWRDDHRRDPNGHQVDLVVGWR